MHYYVTQKEELDAELRNRPDGAGLSQKIDAFAKKEYGIANFTRISRAKLNLGAGRRYGILCRQIATARIEEVAYVTASRYLGLEPANFTFPGDVFTTRNIDKVNLVKVRLIIGHGQKGDPIVRVQALARPSDCDGKILGKIKLGNETLPAYHSRLREKTFAGFAPPARNIGNLLFNTYLKASANPPPFVFEPALDLPVRKAINDANIETAIPPHNWYYPLYLANFVDGRFVLYETYESKRGGVAKIREDFRAAMDMIRDATGIYPLVVQIPPLDETMLSINEALFETQWQNKITIPENHSGNTVSLFNLIAQQAVAVKKNNMH